MNGTNGKTADSPSLEQNIAAMDDPDFAKDIIRTNQRVREKEPHRLNNMIGLTLLNCSRKDQFTEFEFVPDDWCRNGYEGVHGGVISSVFDTGMGLTSEVYTQKFVSTSSLQISFLRAMLGSRFRLKVRLTHVGRRVVNLYGEISDMKDEKICANCLGTFMILPSRPRGLQL